MLSADQHLLKGVSICGIFNKDTRKITGVGSATETQEYLDMLAASIKDERAHGLKMLLDSNNNIKTDATKYNKLVKACNMSDYDSLVAMAFITGQLDQSPVMEMKSAKYQLSALHFCPMGIIK